MAHMIPWFYGGINVYHLEMQRKQILEAAIDGFLQQRSRLDQQIAELRAELDENTTEGKPIVVPIAKKKKQFSADARRRMAEAQKRRWAKYYAANKKLA